MYARVQGQVIHLEWDSGSRSYITWHFCAKAIEKSPSFALVSFLPCISRDNELNSVTLTRDIIIPLSSTMGVNVDELMF